MNTINDQIARQLAGGKHPNRLINEKSPYLLQHAFNPVDWHPWGEDAFAKARQADKPIFLSIGYSTCYWCHVMEREVFENPAIAEEMNRHLVCIKVDREERPDIDRIYMTAVQAMTGGGGWPMSVFLTPQLKPFFAGTYFPPADSGGRPGFPALVRRISELWRSEREKIMQSGEEITEQLRSLSRTIALPSSSTGERQTRPPAKSTLEKGFVCFQKAFDELFGGFGTAPKFPRPAVLNFLTRYYAFTGDADALNMTVATLRKMAAGGVHDHIGGGFHRYAVDDQWRTPHFEKMLYDQAQICSSFIDAYQITHEEFFAGAARSILGYVRRNLTSPTGGFYSAEDAESALSPDQPEKKREGAFYLWAEEEIDLLLPTEYSDIFKYHYGMLAGGNALHDPRGEFTGKNILYEAHTAFETANAFHRSPEEIMRILEHSRKILFDEREKRPKPYLDDKIITAWNGLMISAFARAAQVLDDPAYCVIAGRAAEFILAALWNPVEKKLLRRYRDGEARYEGTLQDYTFVVQGLLDLYEASFNTKWFIAAIELTTEQIKLLYDNEKGCFNDSDIRRADLLFATSEDHDGAEPAGNSVAALNLLRIAEMTNNAAWRTMAVGVLSAFGGRMERFPEILPQMLCALEWIHSTPKEIIIAGDPGADDTKALIQTVNSIYLPDKVLILADGKERTRAIAAYLPFIRDTEPGTGRATAYVCENYTCNLPVQNPGDLDALLVRQISPKSGTSRIS